MKWAKKRFCLVSPSCGLFRRFVSMETRRKLTKVKPRVARKKATTPEDRKTKFLKLLDKLSGIGKGVWDEDAQEYVNKLRNNDR
jgi:hypothetical protein